MWWMRGLIISGVLGGLAIIGAGIFQLVQDETGTRAEATVKECHGLTTQTTHETCTGSWVIGGSLINGNGHVVVGDISGATDSDVGKTLHVTVRNGTAYTRGLLIPIVLIGVGIFLGAASGLIGALLWSPSSSGPEPSG
jgi:hypothetical protein